jgi:AraC-like DNA-binding protein
LGRLKRIPVLLEVDPVDLESLWALCYALSEEVFDIKLIFVGGTDKNAGLKICAKILSDAKRLDIPLVCENGRAGEAGLAWDYIADFSLENYGGILYESAKEALKGLPGGVKAVSLTPGLRFEALRKANGGVAKDIEIILQPENPVKRKKSVLPVFSYLSIKIYSVLSFIIFRYKAFTSDAFKDDAYNEPLPVVANLIPLWRVCGAYRQPAGGGFNMNADEAESLMIEAVHKICEYPVRVSDNDIFIRLSTRRMNPELSVYEWGMEKCDPTHSFGPYTRQYYMIHLVASGKGYLHVNDKIFTVYAEQAFLIVPGVPVFYRADEKDPWKYYWVGFNGLEAKQLLKMSGFTEGVFTVKPDNFDETLKYLKRMTEIRGRTASNEYEILGNLYILFSKLFSGSASTETPSPVGKRSHISRAVKYINKHLTEKLTVAQIANHVGLERTYLYKIFKQTMGLSIQAYMIGLKVDLALVLLKDTNMSLKTISENLGYDIYASFFRVFKERQKTSPSEYLSVSVEKQV